MPEKLGKGSPSARENLSSLGGHYSIPSPSAKEPSTALFRAEREMKEKKRVKAHRLVLETSRKEAVKELN